MPVASPRSYLLEILKILKTHWPANRAINIAVHGHSVPAGYFATPRVDTFNAYPHLLHYQLNQRFPFSTVNVIVTAIGGETSIAGAARFQKEVMCHRPDVLLIDYALNDRRSGLDAARSAWTSMIEQSLQLGARILLLTGTPDNTQHPHVDPEQQRPLREHAALTRELAEKFDLGLVDSLAAFDRCIAAGGKLEDLLSWSNHPNRHGHELVAQEIMRYFPADV